MQYLERLTNWNLEQEKFGATVPGEVIHKDVYSPFEWLFSGQTVTTLFLMTTLLN